MAFNKDNFRVKSAEDAKEIGKSFLEEIDLVRVIDFGLPEVDDRYSVWRVPLKSKSGERIGELVIDAITTLIDRNKTTEKVVLENRLLGRSEKKKKVVNRGEAVKLSTLRNTIGLGDSEELLKELPAESIDLVFTSPPYYNAKPEYAEYFGTVA